MAQLTLSDLKAASVFDAKRLGHSRLIESRGRRQNTDSQDDGGRTTRFGGGSDRFDKVAARWFHRRIAGIAAGASGFFLLSLLLTVAAHAQPGLWVVRDQDSTFYVFGTVHTLRSGDAWRSPILECAFARSSELIVEVAAADDADRMATVMREHGVDNERALSSRLDQEHAASLSSTLRTFGADPARMDRLRPWLAALSIGQFPMSRAGYDPALGPDFTLKREARGRQLTITGLETAEEQVLRFARLPEPLQVDLLNDVLDGMSQVLERMEQVRNAWLANDLDALNRLINGLRTRHAQLHDSIFLQRNRLMAERISARLREGSGTAFVAIGAGHLVGDRSVLVHLAELGHHPVQLHSCTPDLPREAR